jgi:trk system potassium uptake protein TrkA
MKNVLVIGAGRFGRYTIRKLHDMGHQILVIDREESRINKILNLVSDARIGDSTNQEFLQTLGVETFDVCVVAIGDDFQSSLETTALLRECGAKFIVSRASRDVQEKLLLHNGADEVVYPEKQLAEWAAICYSSNYILDYIAVGEDFSLYEIAVPERWVGRSVAQLNIRRRYQINVVALKQGGRILSDINPDAPLTGDLTLLVIGRDKDVQMILR